MENDITKNDNALGTIALEKLKAYYENFYNKYAATAPQKVASIKYFLDWLNGTATADDIIVKKTISHLRKATLNVDAKYFWKIATDVYSNYYHTQGNVEALFSDDQTFTSYFHDVYFSEHANSKIIPGNINEVAEKEAKKALKEQDPKYILSETRIIEYNVEDPVDNEYLLCTVNYPHPVADKDGGNIRTFQFIIWNDTFYLINENFGPADVSGKPVGATGGCYVATAVYGSYDCPEVWTLRRYRDETLGSTWYGRLFIRLYYAISPTLVKWFGNTNWFKKMWKGKLDKMVKNLNDKGVENTPYEDKDWTK